MPIFVYVILGIALLLALLLSSKIKLIIVYEDALTVYAEFLFLKYIIISENDNEKPKKKEKKKSKKKKSAPTNEVQNKPSNEKKQEKSTLTKLFEIKEIILRFINKFFKKLHFKFIKLRIVVACENAAATALAYGAVTQGVSYILKLLDSISTVEINKNSNISVTSDFLSQKSEFEGRVELYARLLPALMVGIGSFMDYVKHKSNTEE